MHERDEDCSVDLETLTCTECGVYHGGPECLECGGVAFHLAGCSGDARAPLFGIGLDPAEFIRGARRILDASGVRDEDETTPE